MMIMMTRLDCLMLSTGFLIAFNIQTSLALPLICKDTEEKLKSYTHGVLSKCRAEIKHITPQSFKICWHPSTTKFCDRGKTHEKIQCIANMIENYMSESGNLTQTFKGKCLSPLQAIPTKILKCIGVRAPGRPKKTKEQLCAMMSYGFPDYLDKLRNNFNVSE